MAILPGEWTVWDTYWASQTWVRPREDNSPWLVRGPVGLTGELWEACIPLLRSLHMLVCSWVREGRVDGQLFVQFWKTVPVCTLAWAEKMLQPHLFHDIAPHWHEGCYGQGENSLWDTEVAQTQSVSEQCGSSHRWHLDSQHIRGRPNLCLCLDCQSLHPDLYQELTQVPHALWRGKKPGQGNTVLVESSAVGQKRPEDLKQHLIRTLVTITITYTGSTSGAIYSLTLTEPLHLIPQTMQNFHTSLFCSSIATLWGKGASVGREENYT